MRRRRALIASLVWALASSARADDARRPHSFAAGETLRYDFEDTDTTFSTVMKDGTIQAAAPISVKEIRIPVTIAVSRDGEKLVRRMTISPSADYRESRPGDLAATPFRPVIELDTGVPSSFSYVYADDKDALDHLQKTFENIRKGDIGGFLFYKMEDVHQMQESAANIPEGILPGQTHATPGHERRGLGGRFVAASSFLIYRSTETYDGVKAGYFKASSLGHEFSIPSLKAYTNFCFTMHVALEGPARGLLLFGEGQETATALRGDGKGAFTPAAILQRQFSIRLVEP